MWLAVAQALTMWMADLAVALSKLCRSALPSMATSCPALTPVQRGDPTEQAPLEPGGLDRLEEGVEAVVRGDAAARVEEPGQPGSFLAAPGGDGDEVVGPGDHGAQGDGHDVDERIGDLAAAGVGQVGKVVPGLDGEFVRHGAGHPEDFGVSVAGPKADITEDHHVSIIPNYPSWRDRPGWLTAASATFLGSDGWLRHPHDGRTGERAAGAYRVEKALDACLHLDRDDRGGVPRSPGRTQVTADVDRLTQPDDRPPGAARGGVLDTQGVLLELRQELRQSLDRRALADVIPRVAEELDGDKEVVEVDPE